MQYEAPAVEREPTILYDGSRVHLSSTGSDTFVALSVQAATTLMTDCLKLRRKARASAPREICFHGCAPGDDRATLRYGADIEAFQVSCASSSAANYTEAEMLMLAVFGLAMLERAQQNAGSLVHMSDVLVPTYT